MERVSLPDATDLDEVVESVCAEAGLLDRTGEVREMAARCLSSAAVRSALDSGTYWREVPFTVTRDGGFAVGRVDLVYREGDALVVVDYKSDEVAAAQVGARLTAGCAASESAVHCHLFQPMMTMLVNPALTSRYWTVEWSSSSPSTVLSLRQSRAAQGSRARSQASSHPQPLVDGRAPTGQTTPLIRPTPRAQDASGRAAGLRERLNRGRRSAAVGERDGPIAARPASA